MLEKLEVGVEVRAWSCDCRRIRCVTIPPEAVHVLIALYVGDHLSPDVAMVQGRIQGLCERMEEAVSVPVIGLPGGRMSVDPTSYPGQGRSRVTSKEGRGNGLVVTSSGDVGVSLLMSIRGGVSVAARWCAVSRGTGSVLSFREVADDDCEQT